MKKVPIRHRRGTKINPENFLYTLFLFRLNVYCPSLHDFSFIFTLRLKFVEILRDTYETMTEARIYYAHQMTDNTKMYVGFCQGLSVPLKITAQSSNLIPEAPKP